MINEQKTHIKKGLAIASIIIFFDIVLQLTHNKFQPWAIYVSSAILLVGVVVSILIHNNSSNTPTQFSSLFGYGFQVSGVVVCILFIYTILSVYWVFPGYVNEIYLQSIDQAKRTPNNDIANLEGQKPMAIKVLSLSLLSFVVMVNLALGVIGSLIGSLVAKKKK